MRILVFFILLSINAAGQITETASITFPMDINYLEKIDIVSVDEERLLLINYKENIDFRKGKIIALTIFDKDLNEKWKESIPIQPYKTLHNYKIKNGFLYYLFGDPNSNQLELVIVDLSSKSWSILHFDTLTKLSKIDFDIFSGQIMIFGEFKFKPIIEVHNLVRNTAVLLPGVHIKNHRVNLLSINPYRNEIYVLLQHRNNCMSTLFVYDDQLKLVSKNNIGDKRHLLTNHTIKYKLNGSPIILGTYGNKCNNYSTGVFHSSIDHPGDINFFEFSSMNSYVNDLPDNKKKRGLLRKGRNMQIKQMTLYTIQDLNDEGYLALGEFYLQHIIRTFRQSLYQGIIKHTNYDVYEYKVKSLFTIEMNFESGVKMEQLVNIDGNIFKELTPQSAYLIKNRNFYTLIPSGKEITYFNNSSTEIVGNKIDLFKNPNLRARKVEVNLKNFNDGIVIAYGVFENDFLRDNHNYTERQFYLKKLEVSP